MKNQSMIRYEEKFVITKSQYEVLIKYLLKHMRFDKYSENGLFYKIFNIYFDTEDYHVIQKSIEKPKYKEKLRLRSYQCNVTKDDFVFLEIKKKINGIGVKRRIKLLYEEALDFVINKKDPIITDQNSLQVCREIEYYLSINEVFPKMMIAYERQALTSKEQTCLRVTFDKNIIYRTDHLLESSCEGKNLLNEDEYVLEIKSDQNFPMWLVLKLGELSIYTKTFSKYGEAYKKIRKGELL